MENNLSAADIAAVTGRGYYGNDGFGFGGGQGLWLFAILALMGGGFGNWNNRGNAATTEDVASGFNFSALQNKTNELGRDIAGVNTNLGNAICQLGYQNAKDYASLSQQLATCCCETQRSIDTVKFDMANYAATTNANTTAGIQKILDRMAQDREAALQARINQLELQNQFCGVVRYPTSTTFATNCNPFFGFNNNCGNCCA